MSDEIRAAAERLRELRPATLRAMGDPGIVAAAYLAEHTPTPDGPPAAAPERWVRPISTVRFGRQWEVWETLPGEKSPSCAGVANTEADAELLVSGRARLRAMEAALRGLRYPNEPARFCDHAAEPCSRCEAARAALGAGPGGGT